MFSIAETIAGRVVLHDIGALRLPGDEVLAHTLDGAELYRRLAAIGVADINVCQGKQELLVQYSRHRKAREAEAVDAAMHHLRAEPEEAA